ncbi:MAG: hypothetical protein IPK26_08820 [Planctomycetes bacterium]|nr:hypothetical protein [Planctomycetota bacterium]
MPLTTAAHPAILKDEPGTRVERIGDGADAVVSKTYHNHGLRLLQTFGRKSRASREHDNLAAVADAGIACTEPIGWREQRRLGFAISSTLVTRFVPDCRPLKAVLGELTPAHTFATRRRIVAAMGRVLHALHRAGIAWCTPMPRNFLLQGAPEQAQLFVCDVPAAIRTAAPLPRALQDLDLHDAVFSASRRRDFSAPERLRYLLAALGGDRTAARSTWRRLAARSGWRHRLHKNLVMAWRTYILAPFRHEPPKPGTPVR